MNQLPGGERNGRKNPRFSAPVEHGRAWTLHADIAETIIRPFGRAFQLGIVLTGQTQASELEMRVALVNLTAGPETRYYVAQFLEGYAVVAEISDVLLMTVPGKA